MRYFRLWLAFLKASWMADLEYRMNIVVRVAGEIVWYIVQLSVFEVLYLHTSKISGWDVRGMRVFMGSLFLVDNLYWLLFGENLDNLNAVVRKGDLDLYLTKPVNSQFMVSFRKVTISFAFNILLVSFYLGWAITQLERHPTSAQLFGFLLLVISGVGCYYALRFMFSALVILIQDAGNVQFVWHQLFRLATRPDPIYPPAVRWLILTAFPVAFMASVPARILVEGIDPRLLLAAPAMAAGLVILSHRMWRWALRHYSSASS